MELETKVTIERLKGEHLIVLAEKFRIRPLIVKIYSIRMCCHILGIEVDDSVTFDQFMEHKDFILAAIQ
ncbi:MAG: hypothetical protein EOM14_13130 [Clostridia bacterium]|nr:hypothetical protein [Clostridia bacterium]